MGVGVATMSDFLVDLIEFGATSIGTRLRDHSLEFNEGNDVPNNCFKRRTSCSVSSRPELLPLHRLDSRPDIFDGFQQNQAALVGQIVVDCPNLSSEYAIDGNAHSRCFPIHCAATTDH